MFAEYLKITANQYKAAFSTLNRCMKSCSDEQWFTPVARLSYSQSVFHALFYADFYLHPTMDDSFREQDFHRENRDSFRDYEELLDKRQEYQYERPFAEAYLAHCLAKLQEQFETATEEWMLEPSPFPWIKSTRSEVHIYNIRHIQHHAAQLILTLRNNGLEEFPWFRSGWEPTK